MANSPSGESVVARIARIIAAFDPEHEVLSLTSLAQRAGLPMSTAQRLVTDLLAHHFLERTAAGLLQTGDLIRQSGITGPTEAYVGLRNAAVPMMESVHAVLKQQITLAVLDNDQTLYLERVAQGSTSTNITQKMARLPMLHTPSGLVLLAHQPSSYQETFLASVAPGREDLRAVLAGARSEGYVTRPGIITKGTLAVSVPVLGDEEGLPAALTAVITEAGAQIPLTVAVLRAASHAITAAMKFSHLPALNSRRPVGLLDSRRL
jgi:DNA-binding IclR family transcriptional regulator